MSVGATNVTGNATDVYAAYAAKDTGAKATEAIKSESAAAENKITEKTSNDKAASEGVVYEKSNTDDKKAPYTINKMSAEERASLVEKLKADQANRQSQLLDIVKQMMTKQATTFGQANFGNVDNEDVWKFLAKGDYTVDAQTKAQAQADIAEDGYWGVKETSQRLFDFASALAGDDEEQMKKMQSAMEKGFKQATETWGQDIPDISKDTLEAANKLFEEYYASKQAGVTE